MCKIYEIIEKIKFEENIDEYKIELENTLKNFFIIITSIEDRRCTK